MLRSLQVMIITFQDIIDNLFYVHIKYNKQTNTRKVVVYNNDSANKMSSIQKRLLSSVIILCFSQEFTTHYKKVRDLFDFYENQGNELTTPKHVNKFAKFKVPINRQEVPDRCIGYLVYMLSSFFHLNDLLNDFYYIFGRKLVYEKQQFEEQTWESIIKDDFLFSMLLFGLDNLIIIQKTSKSSKEYFDNLITTYSKYQKVYLDTIIDSKLPVKDSFNRELNAKLEVEEQVVLNDNSYFDYIIDMNSKEIQRTKQIILSLFALTASPELVKKIHEDSILRTQIKEGVVTIDQALDFLFLQSRNLDEYQKFALENKNYHYINSAIASSLKDVVSDRILSPFPLPFAPE